ETPAPETPAPEKCEWTIMIFMVGDNNLSDKCKEDLLEIKKAGSSKDVKVIVQADLSRAGGRTTRYFITPQGTLAENANGWWTETPPEVLKHFIHWCISHHPAKHYMLLLWGHGRALDSFQVNERPPAVRPYRFSRQTRARTTNGRDADKPFFIICPDDQA